MAKLIFRVTSTILVLIILTVVLAFWKGGAPFRWAGEKTVAAGETIIHFGDIVDELKGGAKKTQEILTQLKESEILGTELEDTISQEKGSE